MIEYRGNTIDNNGIHLVHKKLDEYIDNMTNADFSEKQAMKAVLSVNQKDNMRLLYEVLAYSISKYEFIDNLRRACSDYFASNEFMRDLHNMSTEFREIETPEDVVEALIKSGVKPSNKYTIAETVYANYVKIKYRAQIFTDIIYMYYKTNTTEFSEDKFLQDVYDKIEEKYDQYINHK